MTLAQTPVGGTNVYQMSLNPGQSVGPSVVAPQVEKGWLAIGAVSGIAAAQALFDGTQLGCVRSTKNGFGVHEPPHHARRM